jgi:hypothetical protein
VKDKAALFSDKVRGLHILPAWKLEMILHLNPFPQATNVLCVCIVELFIEWLSPARVSDVVFGMKVTAHLSANSVTGFIRQQ